MYAFVKTTAFGFFNGKGNGAMINLVVLRII